MITTVKYMSVPCKTCGHAYADHAISLKGKVGACLVVTRQYGSACHCEKYIPAYEPMEKDHE